MMSILKKKPRHEVISIRLSEDRLKLLERYQKVLSEQRGREVSLGEAAFLVIEERVEGMDRETARHEMLSTPTASLYRIRKKWESQHPGTIGRCLLAAISDEGVESTRLDQILAPYWPTLWGLAARGHWVRHDRQPVRPTGPNEDDFRRRIILPKPLKVDDLKLSFTTTGCPELGVYIDFGPTRRVNYLIARYPDLAEFRAMLEGWSAKNSWNGRHFLTTLSEEKGPTFTLWLRQNDVGINFTENEWSAVRELFQKAWAIPELQRWVQELQLEYGEEG